MKTLRDIFSDTEGTFKQIYFTIVDIFLSRKQVIRISKAMLNRALGNNNDNMATNGEISLIHQVLELPRAVDHKLVAFDVGANIGQWANAFLELAEKQDRGGVVHCFEPSTATFNKLETTLKRYRSEKKVFCINAGLSDLKGTRNLYIQEEGSGINSFYNRRLEGIDISYDESETVQVTTVDAYCYETDISHIDFLKVDVEGHELAVLRGAEEMLKNQTIEYVQFEYGGCWIDSRVLFLDMYDYLTSFGYVIGKIMPNGVEYYDKYDQRLETFQMANYIACLPEKMHLFK